MKKFLVYKIFGLFLASGPAFANPDCESKQCPMANAKIIDKKVNKLASKLDLNDSQKTQVRAALEKKMQGKDAVMQEVQPKLAKVHEEYQTSMNAILNEAQKKKYEKLTEKYRKCDGKDCDAESDCPHH